jgi:hypothetical protein
MPKLKDAPVGCAVYVRSEDHLLERGSEVWGVPMDEMIELRRMIDALVDSVDWQVLTIVMPDELLSSASVIESDRIADVAMLAAVDAWIQLRNSRLVPDGIRGRLAAMSARSAELLNFHRGRPRERNFARCGIRPDTSRNIRRYPRSRRDPQQRPGRLARTFKVRGKF